MEPVSTMLLTPERQRMFREFSDASIHEVDCWRNKEYPYIPLWHSQFTQMVEPFLRPNMSVVDVGCGAGDKLLAFADLEPTLKITGIEYDPTMCRIARYMTPTIANIIEGNAFDQHYDQYDLIYMYCPISDPFLQTKLQWEIMCKMRSGAVLCVALQQEHKDFPMMPDLRDGWRKP